VKKGGLNPSVYAVFAGFTHTSIGTTDSTQIASPRPLIQGLQINGFMLPSMTNCGGRRPSVLRNQVRYGGFRKHSAETS
jgi:hypothetical protein